MTDNLVIDKLMDIQRSIGTMENEIRNTCKDMILVQKDIAEMNKKFHSSSLVLTPNQTKIVIAIVTIILGALGYTQI